MVVCSNCQVEVDEAEINEAGGFSSCPNCGSVWDDLAFSTDPTFQKGADGEGEMLGQYVSETGHVRGLGRMAGGRYYPTSVRLSELAARDSCVARAATACSSTLPPHAGFRWAAPVVMCQMEGSVGLEVLQQATCAVYKESLLSHAFACLCLGRHGPMCMAPAPRQHLQQHSDAM
jgi:hypothetical protein